MRADPDFAAYVVARWVPVVRVLVVLGESVDEAADIAVATFARLLPDWGRLRREGDVDVELGRLLLDAWVRSRDQERVARTPVPVPTVPVVTQELEDRLEMLERLVDGLDQLDEATRVTVVLHYLGELDQEQVADVLGEPRAQVRLRLGNAAAALDLGALDPVCHSAATAIDPPPPSVRRVVARANAARRRQWLVTGAIVGSLALIAGIAYTTTRPSGPDRPDALAVSPVENVVDVPWWLDGTLHLAHGTVEVDDLVQLVATSDGVVYVDSDDRLTSVSDDGVRLDLGDIARESVIVSQPRSGWVAWTLPDGGDTVVYDTVRDREIGRVDATVDTKLIGFDRERLYYHSHGADWVVTVNGGATLTEPDKIPTPQGAFGSALLDVSSGTQLRSAAGSLEVIAPLTGLEQGVPGTVGQLSNDGNFALTRVGDEVSLWDVRDGTVEGDWFARQGWTTLAGAFTPDGRIAWVVDSGEADHGLYECQVSRDYVDSSEPESQPCTQRYDVEGVPVLAGAVADLNVVTAP